MSFPDLEEIVALAGSDYERQFVRAEFAPGFDYYLNRIDRLLFAGNRVLDAGCGVGQWSMALARRFGRVDSVDLKHERLVVLRAVARRMGVANVFACLGSLESLPYGDAAFDAVFCYGVIMFTRVEQALAEFHRVLRPSGRVYLCVNADGWSRQLAAGLGSRTEGNGNTTENGHATENTNGAGNTAANGLNAGLTTLYTTYWRRALEHGLRDALVEGAAEYPEGLLAWEERLLFKLYRRITRILRRVMAVAGGIDWKRSQARDALCRSRVGRELLRRVHGFCGEEFVPMLLDDVSELLETGEVAPRFGPTRAIQPDEMASLAGNAGFVDFQWSVESGLACDWSKAAVPKYPGYHGDELCVWECLFAKPDRRCVAVSLERHFAAARQAAGALAYVESSAEPVLSNASNSTFSAPLTLHARWLAERLGGPSYLEQLARTIVAGVTDDEQAVRRIICFVQKAMFRDPVAQPLLDDGALPDALTSLLCARGRCGHAARVLAELFHHAGLEARVRQLPRHVIAEAKCSNRWVVADADAFKGGIIPEAPDGRLLTMEQIEAHPYVLDRYPPTGWMVRPHSKYTCGFLGHRVRGYVDALEPEQRGFVSGHYVPRASGFPPSLPEIRHFKADGDRITLAWTASHVRDGRLLGYRVRVGTRSRGWTYDDVFLAEAPLAHTASDLLDIQTTELSAEIAKESATFFLQRGGGTQSDGLAAAKQKSAEINSRTAHVARGSLFASVTAISDRAELEPLTFFWPSEEARCELV